MARQVLENGVILPAEYSDDWYDDMTSNLTKLDDVIGSDSEKLSSADVGAAALSNNYNDLDNLPTIPTVNDATLTIQKNGVDVQTFTANASSNVTANITVPTKTSDLTNDSNFVDTSNSAVASGITSAKVTAYDSHIADTDIHVTTADKTKWNNGVTQSYVFRYSSTALVASSTNSNTLLDNTDNLKVGDKVIDSDGVLFSITAIDNVNSTFTIGSALIDLAQDSDVVHKSGNETISGNKTFSGNVSIYNSDASVDAKYLILKNQKVKRGSTTETGSQFITFHDKDSGTLVSYETSVSGSGNTQAYINVSNLDANSQRVVGGVKIIKTPTETWFIPDGDNTVSSGLSNYKWKDVQTKLINGLTPSSLGMPATTGTVDISGYITALDGTFKSYTVPANGWISIAVVGTAIAIVSSRWSDSRLRESSGNVRMLYPVLKDETLNISVIGTTLAYARFFPCQGNI